MYTVRPLHMEADDWARSLDRRQDAYGFETTLTTHGQVLGRARVEHGPGKPDTITKEENVSPLGHCDIFSAGDDRIWHRKVEDCVHQQHLRDESQVSECIRDDKEKAQSALRHRIDLIEALMGHGILQEHDLRILSTSHDGAIDSGCNSVAKCAAMMGAKQTCRHSVTTHRHGVAPAKNTTADETMDALNSAQVVIDGVSMPLLLVTPLRLPEGVDMASLLRRTTQPG